MKMMYRPVGEMQGFNPTEDEMSEATLKMFPDSRYIDKALPVEGFTGVPCSAKDAHDDPECGVYWEWDDGYHGWACKVCGMVLQWG